MIPIKIHCGCGHKYAFEIDPANPLVDQSVRCPVCDADGTAATRNLIAEHAASPAPRKLGIRPSECSHSTQPPEPAHHELAHAQTRLDNRRTKNWLVPAMVGGILIMAVVGVSVARSQSRKRVAGSQVANAPDEFPETLAQVQAWSSRKAGAMEPSFTSRALTRFNCAIFPSRKFPSSESRKSLLHPPP